LGVIPAIQAQLVDLQLHGEKPVFGEVLMQTNSRNNDGISVLAAITSKVVTPIAYNTTDSWHCRLWLVRWLCKMTAGTAVRHPVLPANVPSNGLNKPERS
jgi:hypothetical protein